MRSASSQLRRTRRRASWAATLRAAPSAAELAADPLEGRRTAAVDAVVLGALAAFAAVGAHVVFTAAIWGVGELLKDDERRQKDERVAVTVIEEPELPEPEPEPEPEPPPPESEPPPPQPKPVAKPPPPKPIDQPPPPPPPKPPTKIVGIDIGSTVAGGNGPAYATGDDLDGHTEPVAREPKPADKMKAPPTKEAPSSNDAPKNRTATRVPAGGVELVKPKRLSSVKPSYPATLRAQGVEADVVVQVELDATGAVVDASIVSGSGYREMDSAALIAARKERFKPATRDGTEIEFTLTYTIRFRLSDA